MSARREPLPDRVARRVRPVRSRLTLLATGLVIVALLVAGTVLVFVLHRVLLDRADGANSARAQEIAAALGDGGPTDLDAALLVTDQNIDLVQVLGADGRVLRSSRTHPQGALGPPLPPGRQVTVDGAEARPSDAEYRATRLGVATPDGPVTVEVGTGEAGINRLVLLVAALCAAVFPLIVVVMAVLTHVLVGRALLPVERIRRRVDEISGADLSERVPVPDTRDEVATLAATMNSMLARLQDAQAAQQRFVGDASHELNSPLTAVYGLLDLALVTGEPIDVDTVRSVMMPEAVRIRRLVADLALLARADERGTPLRRQRVDLAELVTAEADRLRAGGADDVQVVVDIAAAPAPVLADPAQLARVLRNLTDNAARYVRDRLALELTVTGPTVTVAVTDDGPGVPEADRARVFERFVRLDAARDRARGGSGLGLAIVAEIVAAHGGTVGVGSGPAGGARFVVSLPLDRPPDRSGSPLP